LCRAVWPDERTVKPEYAPPIPTTGREFNKILRDYELQMAFQLLELSELSPDDIDLTGSQPYEARPYLLGYLSRQPLFGVWLVTESYPKAIGTVLGLTWTLIVEDLIAQRAELAWPESWKMWKSLYTRASGEKVTTRQPPPQAPKGAPLTERWQAEEARSRWQQKSKDPADAIYGVMVRHRTEIQRREAIVSMGLEIGGAVRERYPSSIEAAATTLGIAREFGVAGFFDRPHPWKSAL
jgi:hypothetical protein